MSDEKKEPALFDFADKAFSEAAKFRVADALKTLPSIESVIPTAAWKVVEKACSGKHFTYASSYRISEDEIGLLCEFAKAMADGELDFSEPDKHPALDAIAKKLSLMIAPCSALVSKRLFNSVSKNKAVMLAGRLAIEADPAREIRVEDISRSESWHDAVTVVSDRTSPGDVFKVGIKNNAKAMGSEHSRDAALIRRQILGNPDAKTMQTLAVMLFGDNHNKAFSRDASFRPEARFRSPKAYADQAERNEQNNMMRFCVNVGMLLSNFNRGMINHAIDGADERLLQWIVDNGFSSAIALGKAVGNRSPSIRQISAAAADSKTEAFVDVIRETPAVGLFCARLSPVSGVPVTREIVGATKAFLKREHSLSEGGWKKLCQSLAEKPDSFDSIVSRASDEAVLLRSGRILSAAALPMACSALSMAAAANINPVRASEFLFEASKSIASLSSLKHLFGDGIPSRTVSTPDEALSFAGEWNAKEARKTSVAAAILRLAEERGAKEAVELWSDVWDWLEKSGEDPWQSLPEKPDWNTMSKRSSAWHRVVAEKEAGEKALIRWAPALASPIVDKESQLQAAELSSGLDLWTEGREMRHCVSSYSDKCMQGRCRILSVRDLDGKPLATVEIAPVEISSAKVRKGFDQQEQPRDQSSPATAFGLLDSDEPSFSIVQIRGKCNSSAISPAVRELAQRAADEYSKNVSIAMREHFARLGDPSSCQSDPEPLSGARRRAP